MYIVSKFLAAYVHQNLNPTSTSYSDEIVESPRKNQSTNYTHDSRCGEPSIVFELRNSNETDNRHIKQAETQHIGDAESTSSVCEVQQATNSDLRSPKDGPTMSVVGRQHS